jgi:hypothetical protein
MNMGKDNWRKICQKMVKDVMENAIEWDAEWERQGYLWERIGKNKKG